jgi:RimJ/RimL family protein N-acetyltransferase
MLLDRFGKPHTSTLPANPARRADVLRELRARVTCGDARLLEAAQFYCDWPLALELYRHRLEREGQSAALLSRVGLAALRIGALETARCCSTRVGFLDPEERGGRQLQRELSQWEPWRRRFPETSPADLASARLRLEPLGPHHWGDLWWQYQDPEIPRLCCLPVFRDQSEWQRWLGLEYGHRGTFMFAVLEQHWGFAGVVSLMLHRRVGFLYYWLGRDFRGCGLAREAVARLLSTAGERWGMHACYAKVFDHNAASRRLLSHTGFRQLGLKLQAPHSNQCLYRWGAERSLAEEHSELHQLFADMRCQLRLLPRVLPV